MARWIEGEVVDNIHWTDTHHSLRVAAGIAPFAAGQFGRLGLEVDGKPMGRPYSFVNPPDDPVLEFYSTMVPDGPISPRLHTMRTGDRVLVSPKGGGYFTLDQVPDARHVWLLATGTAIGPYLSILRTEAPWQRFDRVILVHAARHARELTYRGTIEALAEAHGDQFDYVPFISRESANFAMPGRIPPAIEQGALEQRVGLTLDPATCQVMLCGNPDMLRDAQSVLGERGFAANNRKQTGHITTEQYW